MKIHQYLQQQLFAQVIVPDDQLSLAIGKSGQNARLAARLTDWKIDIKSESQIRKILESQEEEDLADEQESVENEAEEGNEQNEKDCTKNLHGM